MNSSSYQSSSLVVIGDGSVGKSSIISAFRINGFQQVYKQTIGCDFYEKTLKIKGDIHISLSVWDIGGQSIQSKNLDKYIGTATAIFLVYDITNADSFNNLNDWLIYVRKYSTCKTIYLVGNKIDLIHLRQVPEYNHKLFIESNNLQGGMFVSAKTGDNVVKSFYQIASDSVGIKLSSAELEVHDKVLTAYITKGDDSKEGRTAFADEIEAEDLAAEMKKNTSSTSCCILS